MHKMLIVQVLSTLYREVRRMPSQVLRKRLAACRPGTGLLGLVLALGMSRTAPAANGDLIKSSDVLGNLKEYGGICADTDGTFWAVGENTGKIAHLDATLTTKIGEITNPHGAGTFPNYILSRGIAFRPASETLIVLAKSGADFKVKEVDRQGTEVPPGFTINTSALPGANLFGMAYDPTNDQIWLIDDNNDLVIRSNMSGIPLNRFSFPLDVPAETILRGTGVSFDKDGVTPYLYITYGDIFTLAPTKVLELTVNGFPTGVEIPLANVPPVDAGKPVDKIGALLIGSFGGKQAATVIGARGLLHVLEFTRPDPVPPTFFTAKLTLDNQVALSWTNHGTGVLGAYSGGLSILRNGLPLYLNQQGNLSSYLDTTPPADGHVTYTIKGSNGGMFSASVSADVVVGKGGLIRWIPFPASQPFDLARNPANGELFVTDTIAGRILHFDQNLVYMDDVPSPYPKPGGIAFRPEGDGGAGSLMVAESEGVRMIEIDLAGNHLDQNVPIDLRPLDTPKVGGLVYNPDNARYTCVETTSHQLFSFDRNGNQLAVCQPPETFTEKLNEGIGFDRFTGHFQATFDGGVVREMFFNCTPTSFNFDLSSLGQLSTQPGFVKGVEIADNVLFIASGTANALFQVLIFPQGQTFIRGDLDRDGQVQLNDVVFIANYLFKNGVVPFCLDAADTNDDGELDISDPVYLLYWMFVPGSPPPPEPYPNPGHDLTFLDKLKC